MVMVRAGLALLQRPSDGDPGHVVIGRRVCAVHNESIFVDRRNGFDGSDASARAIPKRGDHDHRRRSKRLPELDLMGSGS